MICRIPYLQQIHLYQYHAYANNTTSLAIRADASICSDKYLDLSFSTSCVSISPFISSIHLLTVLLLSGIALTALSSFFKGYFKKCFY